MCSNGCIYAYVLKCVQEYMYMYMCIHIHTQRLPETRMKTLPKKQSRHIQILFLCTTAHAPSTFYLRHLHLVFYDICTQFYIHIGCEVRHHDPYFSNLLFDAIIYYIFIFRIEQLFQGELAGHLLPQYTKIQCHIQKQKWRETRHVYF